MSAGTISRRSRGICIISIALPLLALQALGNEAPRLTNNNQSSLQTGINLFTQGRRHWNVDTLLAARPPLQQAATDDPQDYRTWYMQGLNDFYTVLCDQSMPEDQQDEKQLDTALTNALASLERVTELNPGFAEPYVILAALTGIQIEQNPMSGIWRGRRIKKYQKKALTLEPDNPRVNYLAGVNNFRAPAPIGNNEKALSFLLKAVSLYEKGNHKPADNLPNWGYDHTLMFIGHVYRDMDQPEQALEYYSRAIKENPCLEPQLKADIGKLKPPSKDADGVPPENSQ